METANKKAKKTSRNHKAYRSNRNKSIGIGASRSRGPNVRGRSSTSRSRARGGRGSFRGHNGRGKNQSNRGKLNEHPSDRDSCDRGEDNLTNYDNGNFGFADGTGGLGASYYAGSWDGYYDTGGLEDNYSSGNWESDYDTGGFEEGYGTSNMEDGYEVAMGSNRQRGKGRNDRNTNSKRKIDGDQNWENRGGGSPSNEREGTATRGNCKKGGKIKNLSHEPRGNSSSTKCLINSKTVAGQEYYTQSRMQRGKKVLSVLYNDPRCYRGTFEEAYENENGIGNYGMSDLINSYNMRTRDEHEGTVNNTNYTDMDRKVDVGGDLRWKVEESYKDVVERGVFKGVNQRGKNFVKLEHNEKRKSWVIEEDNSEINLHRNRNNESLPQVKKLKESHETSSSGSEIHWNVEAVCQVKQLNEEPKTYLFEPRAFRSVEATAEVKKSIEKDFIAKKEFMEEHEIPSNVLQRKSSVEATSQVQKIKKEWEPSPVVPQNPRMVDATQVAVFTKSEAIHQENFIAAEPRTDMIPFRSAPADDNKEKIRKLSGSVNNEKDKFQTIVLMADVSHFENLKQLQSDKVRVICERFLSLETVVDAIEKNKAEVGKNALWLLVVGFFDLVNEEPDKRCKRCKMPITHMCPLWNLENGDYGSEIDAMLNLTDTCVRNCQAALGDSGVVALTPPLPAYFLKYGNMNHQQLHRCSFKGTTLVNNENYQVLCDIYNKFCVKWITYACWKLQKLLNTSSFENFKMSSFSKYVNCASVSREWYCVMNNFFAMVLDSYYPKEAVKEWLTVRGMFDRVVIVGHTKQASLLRSSIRGLPVTFYNKTMDLDEKGLTVINELKNKWPTRTLWCVVVGITAMADCMKKAQSKCSVTIPKCKRPLPVWVAKNHSSASHDLKGATNDQIVDGIIKSAFSFIHKATKNLGTGSALFVAPIIPQQVVCADIKSQESHGNLHQIFEKDRSIPFLLGSPSCWAYNSLSFAKKWLALSRESFLSSPKFIEEYALLEDRVLDFINTCDEIKATAYQLQHDWSKLMLKLLEYFIKLKVNDPFPFTFGRTEAMESSYEVCIEKYGSFDDFMKETASRHDSSVQITEDQGPPVGVPVKDANFTVCVSDSSSVASPSYYPSAPPTDSMSSSSVTVHRTSTSAIHQSCAQVMFPVPPASKTGSTVASAMAVLPPSATRNLLPSFSPGTTFSSSAQVILPLPSTSVTSVTDLPQSSSVTVQPSFSPGFINFSSTQVTPPVSVHSPEIILPSSTQVTPPVSASFVTDSVVSAPGTILAPSSVEAQRSFSPQVRNPSSSPEIFPVPSTSVPGSLVAASVPVPTVSTTSAPSRKPSQANTLTTSSKKGHIIIRNIETEMNQSQARELFNIFGQVDGMEWPRDGSGTRGRYLMVIYANIIQCKCAARVLNFLKVFGDNSKLKLFGSKKNDENLTLKKKDMALVLRVYEVLQKIKENKNDCEGMKKGSDVCEGKSKVRKEKKVKTVKKARDKGKKSGKKKQQIKDTVTLSDDSEEILPSTWNNVPLAGSSQDTLSDSDLRLSPISSEEAEDVTPVIEVLVSYSGDLISAESINSLFLEIGALEPGVVKNDGMLFFFKKYCVELKLLEDFRFPDGKMKLDVSGVFKDQECTGYERREASERLKCLILTLLSPVEEKMKESILKEINVYTFKTAPCKAGLSCRTKAICLGYHGRSDKRRSPLTYDYSLEMCAENDLQGVCCYRDDCPKSHTAVEKMMHVNFYRSLLCPFVHREGYCKEMRSICYHAHKGESDVFYNDNWENLCVEGLGKSLSFLIGAITNFYKLPDLKCPRVLLITPSQYMADLYLNCISDLAVSCNQKAVQLKLDTSGCGDAAVIIATLDTILPLLPLPYDMVLTEEINLKLLKALIIDDGPTVFSSLGKRHANAFHSFGRYLAGLNIVITAESLSDLDHKMIKEFMNIKRSFEMQGSSQSEGKTRKGDKRSMMSLMPTELSSTTTNTSSKATKSGLKSSHLETPEKKKRVQKSPSVDKKRSRKEKACETSNTTTSDVVKKPITIHSSDEDGIVPDERRRELLQAIEVLEKKRDQELQLYIDAPMIHPLYEKKRILFMKKYKKDFPGRNNKGHAKKLWKMYWTVTVKEFLKSEYQCRFEGLRKKLENISRNTSPESEEEVNVIPSPNNENSEERNISFPVDKVVGERASLIRLPIQLNREVSKKNAEKIPSRELLQKQSPGRKKEKKDSTDYAKVFAQIIQEPNLRQLQAKDETLAVLFFHEKQGTVTKKGTLISSFSMKDGLLYRNVQSKKLGNVNTQLIVPIEYRQIIIKFSHCGLLSGHTGKAKTLDRITKEFYWTTMYKDVKRWTSACEICQHTTPEGCNIVDLTHPVPVIGEPFTRCALDVLGPFNSSLQGYKYILLLTDIATKWPEAVPLKSISTVAVATALGNIFTRLGVPKEILADHGMPLTSSLDEIFRLMRMKGLKSTPEHCPCNGICERLNGSLRRIFKCLCFEQSKFWHEFIKPLLFAYREVEQKSTGFSPLFLLYGHNFRGPMHILRDFLEGNLPENKETCIAYQHVLELKEWLSQTCALILEECKKMGENSLDQPQKRSNLRSYETHDQVLILSHTSSDKLLAEWKGPYVIKKKKKILYYLIDVDGKEREFHVNMLKSFR